MLANKRLYLVIGLVVFSILTVFSIGILSDEKNDTIIPKEEEKSKESETKEKDTVEASEIPDTTSLVDSSEVVAKKEKASLTKEGTKEVVPEPFTKTSDITLMLIGDSMGQGVGWILGPYAQQRGYQFINLAAQNSSIIAWGGGTRLADEIAYYVPDFVIICLGSNDLFGTDMASYQYLIQNMIVQAGDTRFVWIGPPNWKEDNGLTDLLASELGKGRYFSSKELYLPRISDGIHPTLEGYRTWTDAFTEWIENESMHRFPITKLW